MFRKPFRIKSNVTLRASERRAFRERVIAAYPSLKSTDLDDLLSKKDIVAVAKIICSSDMSINVYLVQKKPIFFEMYEVSSTLYPTLPLLFLYPDLLYCFTINPQTMIYITSGADLMLPGVVKCSSLTTHLSYGNVQQGEVVAVNFTTNRCPMAVGESALSSSSMRASGGRGKCVLIYHFINDHLCTFDGMLCPKIPQMGPVEWTKTSSLSDDFPPLGAHPMNNISTSTIASVTPTTSINTDDDTYQSKPIEDIDPNDINMNELLSYCFFSAIKYHPDLKLPVLVSYFNKYMLQMCPSPHNLDIKKTTYKKLRPFLLEKCEEGIIKMEEVKKGVESINHINKDHDRVVEFYIKPDYRVKFNTTGPSGQLIADVLNTCETFIITKDVLPLFEACGLKKGDILTKEQIRNFILDYIGCYDCLDQINKKFVILNDVLSKMLRNSQRMSVNELNENIIDMMRQFNNLAVEHEHKSKTKCGKVQPVRMSVASRSGNKKVTLVDNLGQFGINLNTFAKQCQVGAAASTTINTVAGKKFEQLQVQGNQINVIYNLLTEKYNIPKHYIRGLENAPKPKKK